MATLLALCARYHWVAELATHFRVQYAFLLIGCVAAMATLRSWHSVAFLLLFLVSNLVAIAPAWLPSGRAIEGDSTIRVLASNVLTSNFNSRALLEEIEESKPDVIVLLETNQRWIDDLRELETDYPHQLLRPEDHNFGLAVYSRRPFLQSRFAKLSQDITAAIVTVPARSNDDESAITIIGAHPVPPIGRSGSQLRNKQLQEIAGHAKAQTKPCIVIGDLNVTPWSPYFRDLLVNGNLRDSRLGQGNQASWPNNRLLQIPIDHCLVSSEVVVHQRQVRPSIDSDHLPLLVDLSVSR